MTARFRGKPVSRVSPLRVAALICSLALPASAVAYQVASSQQAGSISGHILTGAAHPVEGAAITLLNAETLIHKVTHSDSSGAYVFSSIPAGQYLLLAFHPGYFAEYFHMVQQLTQGITVRAEQPAANADFKLMTAPPITALRDDAFLASYSAQQRTQLSFCSGAFSTDLRYFAFSTTGIASGDPEQVWRYEPATGQLAPATPKPTAATSPESVSIHWLGESLHVTGTDRSGGRRFEVELAEQGSPSITYTQSSSPSPEAEDPLRSAGRYTLTPTALRGGSTTWSAQLDGKGPHKVIAAGLLNALVVNPGLPFFFYLPVTYPTTFRDDAVAARDLETGHATGQRLPVSTGLQLLAAAPDADGFLLAYQVMGGCVPVPNQDGEDADQLNGFGGLPFQREAAHICFVHLRSPR